MYIKDVFTQFTKERHTEDKGRNHDLLQEIYASTEFVDVSMLNFEGVVLHDFSKVEDTYIATFPVEQLSLPFQNSFVKLNENVFLFIREYSPEIITGTMYSIGEIRAGLTGTLNCPFTIRVNENKIMSDFYEPLLKDYLDTFIQSTFSIILQTSNILNTLNKHAVAVDVPIGTKHEYFRRKHGTTIKVPERPIYYILDKQEEKKKYKYNDIEARGHLEFSHAFKVRGHWRTINEKSLGKDRNGIYKVKGYTWVVEHIRGEGELVKKVRVIR